MDASGTGQPAAHTHPVHDRSNFDVEALPERPQKRVLRTNGSYVEEWRYGSKTRVIKYYLVYMGIGLVVGAIIGVVIGVCIRYVGR